MPEPARCVLVSDFSLHNLAAFLTRDAEAPLACELALFGDVRASLTNVADADVAVVWTSPRAVSPFVGRPEHEAALAAHVDSFADALAALAARVGTVLVASWVVRPHDRGAGMLDWRPGGQAHAVAAMNLRLAERLASARNVFLLDAQRWLAAAGDGGGNPRGWYMGKIPFTPRVFREAADDIKAALVGLRGKAKKLLVVDLDDTLWGGVVGEVGWEQLRLGGHDPKGEAFVDFQRQLKALSARGVILAVVSKNTEQVALDAIHRHPEMVLRLDDLAGWRINWRDKAENLVELVDELNLGLDAVVFVDDHPGERARVRQALPAVLVPEWPKDPMLYVEALGRLRCFDAPVVSAEDQHRTAAYVAERKRQERRPQVGSTEDWLRSLGMVIEIEPLGRGNLARATQLLNKTNQMNLSTRRLTEDELERWAAAPGHGLWTLRLRDELGDAGLTGLVGVEVEGDRARLVDFVLSCRVFGRGMEQVMMHKATTFAAAAGATELEARYLPTAKNGPCAEFFRARSGLTGDAAGVRFTWPLAQPYAPPAYLRIVDASATS